MKKAFAKSVDQPFVEMDLTSTVKVAEVQKCIDQMKEVNDLTWQVFVVSEDGKVKAMFDFEGMVINKRLKDMAGNPKESKTVDIVSIGMKANLYSLTALVKSG